MTTKENMGENMNITDAKAPFDNLDADIILRSSDNIDFRVFKLLLSLASSFFKDMFMLPQASEGVNSNKTRDDLPIIQVTEMGRTLQSLLSLCYPMAAADVTIAPLDTFEEVDMLLAAAIKYNMERVEKWLRGRLISSPFIDRDPVRVFAVACRFRLREEAEIAAKHAARQPILERPYGPELEYMTGGQLYQLQRYQAECHNAVKKVATSFEWIDRGYFVWFQCGQAGNTMDIGSEDADTMQTVQRSNWWISYMENVAKLLEKDACGAVAQSTDVVDKALRESSKCAGCRKKAHTDMREFSRLFGAKIEEVKSEVSGRLHCKHTKVELWIRSCWTCISDRT